MHPPEYPLAYGQWTVHGGTLVCRTPRRRLTVRAPAPLLRAVQTTCDGRTAWPQAAQALACRWPRAEVEAFLRGLADAGALVESAESLALAVASGAVVPGMPPLAGDTERARSAAAAGSLPPRPGPRSALPQTPAARAFAALLRERRSRRTFADVALRQDDLLTVLWACQGVTGRGTGGVPWHRTIASAGNLHGARWLVVVLRSVPGEEGRPGLPAGTYEACFSTRGGVALHATPGGAGTAWELLADPRILRFATALVVPVLSLQAGVRKYGERAPLFALAEAGQSLQNAQLMAAALGLACCLRGDTQAQQVLGLLAQARGAALERATAVVGPSLVLGAAPTGDEETLEARSATVRVGPAARPPPHAGSPPAHAYWAGPVLHGGVRGYACGRAIDAATAVAKAEAEGWERQGWACLGRTWDARACELPSALDLGQFVAYSARQAAHADFPFRVHTRRTRHLWVAGTDVASGQAVHLPAECVHALSALPASRRAMACTSSTTSGIAAFTDAQEALSRATLELLERDAVLRRWLAGVPAPLVDLATLPDAAQRRIRAWESTHRVAVLQFSQALVPVYSVYLQAHSGAFVAVTAAAGYCPEQALDQALFEAEGRLAQPHAAPGKSLLRAADVRTTEDVDRYWCTRRHVPRAGFYAEGPSSERFGRAPAHAADWPQLRDRLLGQGARLLAFDVTPRGAALDQGRRPLNVVRAFVSGLLPAWFDARLAPAGLPAYAEALRAHPRRRPLPIPPLT